MKKSRYFSELSFAYDGEINDLQTDSEGKTVFEARLKEKRQALAAILPMIEFSPEMVLPVFYGAFTFIDPSSVQAAVRCEPDDDDFPAWNELASGVSLAKWAPSLVDAVLAEPAGDAFMVAAAGIEYLRQFDSEASQSVGDGEEESEGDEEDADLAEQGDDWLAEQGFDSARG